LDFTDAHGRSQRNAIERTGTGGRFGVILAAAGAGKTASLTPLVSAWKDMGRDVHGASLAWRQADDLVEAGIEKRDVFAVSVLLDKLGDPDSPLTLTKSSVVAVDEWGLLGTRQGLELLRWREKLGFSIVALGDQKQCQSIQAGAIIDLTRKALGAEQIPDILTTRRQQTEREKQIVGLLRDGRAAEALKLKREDVHRPPESRRPRADDQRTDEPRRAPDQRGRPRGKAKAGHDR
jgi:ATP-dependent exoDNAse (exonuclease V) alpha subunit